jgi:hypothetical protein
MNGGKRGCTQPQKFPDQNCKKHGGGPEESFFGAVFSWTESLFVRRGQMPAEKERTNRQPSLLHKGIAIVRG